MRTGPHRTAIMKRSIRHKNLWHTNCTFSECASTGGHVAHGTIFAPVFMAVRSFRAARGFLVSASCGIIVQGAVPRFAQNHDSGANARLERLKCLIPLKQSSASGANSPHFGAS